MNILVLKELKGPDDPYKVALQEMGSVHFIPVLSIQFINAEQLQNLLTEENFSSIVFTSGNAVKAVKEAFKSVQADAICRCQNMQCYAIGKATQKLANELCFQCKGSTSGNAEDLAKLIIEENSNNADKTFLFPCGQMKREVLPAMLKESGFNLTSVTVYETTANADIYQEMSKYKSQCLQPTIAVYFSPSGVKFSLPKFRELYGEELKDLHFAAIGKTTADALEKAGIIPCCVAKHPTAEDLSQAVQTFLDSKTKK